MPTLGTALLQADDYFGPEASFERCVEELLKGSDLDLLIHCRSYPRLRKYEVQPSQCN